MYKFLCRLKICEMQILRSFRYVGCVVSRTVSRSFLLLVFVCIKLMSKKFRGLIRPEVTLYGWQDFSLQDPPPFPPHTSWLITSRDAPEDTSQLVVKQQSRMHGHQASRASRASPARDPRNTPAVTASTTTHTFLLSHTTKLIVQTVVVVYSIQFG